MNHSRISRLCFRVALLIAAGIFSASLAHADSYTIEHIGNGDHDHAVAVDDFGNYSVWLQFVPEDSCNGVLLKMSEHCYVTTYVNGISVRGTSPAPLWGHPDPVAGAGCPAGVGPEMLISCANGHPFYYVENYGVDGFMSPGLYFGTSPSDYVRGSGSYDGFGVESASGNFAYVDGHDEYVDLALDMDTLAVTPEPGSLALMGTGVLGGLGLLRRRKIRM